MRNRLTHLLNAWLVSHSEVDYNCLVGEIDRMIGVARARSSEILPVGTLAGIRLSAITALDCVRSTRWDERSMSVARLALGAFSRFIQTVERHVLAKYFARELVFVTNPEMIRPPVGLLCSYCDCQIGMDDFGIVAVETTGEPFSAALHYECEIRLSAGSEAHLRRVCDCFGGDVVCDSFSQSSRAKRFEAISAARAYHETNGLLWPIVRRVVAEP